MRLQERISTQTQGLKARSLCNQLSILDALPEASYVSEDTKSHQRRCRISLSNWFVSEGGLSLSSPIIWAFLTT